MRIDPKKIAGFLMAGIVFAAGTAAAQSGIIASIDLSAPFGARSPWRLVATQGAPVEEPSGDTAPGAISLCLTKDKGRTCDPDIQRLLRTSEGDDVFSEPHFLNRAEVVHPRADLSLLLLQVASVHAGNGDQRIALQLLAYDRARDRFVRSFEQRVGRNNNQEIRYVVDGPLKGDVISSEPTEDAPFGYWITVSRLTSAALYKQVLRYRSATAYGDGNPLTVIDSEMPNVQQRLGLWHPGMPLPVPKSGCARPHLVRMALWCR